MWTCRISGRAAVADDLSSRDGLPRRDAYLREVRIQGREAIAVPYHDPFAVGITAADRVGISRAKNSACERRFYWRADRCAKVDAIVTFTGVSTGEGEGRVAEILCHFHATKRPAKNSLPCGWNKRWVDSVLQLALQIGKRRLEACFGGLFFCKNGLE